MIVNGPCKLQGEIEISTSKNAILPILVAGILSDEPIKLYRVPAISDVFIIQEIIAALGMASERKDDTLFFSGRLNSFSPPFELVRQMRASFLLMGPILARCGEVRISLPGGCAIGNRPIDLHLKGLAALGAEIELEAGNIVARSKRLQGRHIYLDYPSVGATENLMMAAAVAEGVSHIENAALEPEIVDLASFINKMGGRIFGAGTNVIRVEGVEKLHGAEYTPIPDRIEAGTYMTAIAASGGEGLIRNVIPEHVKAVSAKLIESGARVSEGAREIHIARRRNIRPLYIKTLPYPGFPTDMQAQMMAYLSRGSGTSIISESVFENRFMHVQELQRMGADIRTEGRTAVIRGVKHLSPATVRASDLRAGAALVIAGLTGNGETVIQESEHIDRGYENMVEKMYALGADIRRE
ncbi:MAG: UDP-N-acetylglucosamine 1-carboxyvinyltransferase [Syntrophomonadaceae bacterium]|nr:UDP-N-acetylglucosamine 1-carboxyvinyltransferase [Syntrophomonadaceae bacterium]